MKNLIILLAFSFSISSCTKETMNTAPTMPSNFYISIGGTSATYSWKASTDADGDAIVYDISVLDDAHSTPLVVATNVSTNSFISSTTPANIPRTMIVTAKDGKGGTTTGVEQPGTSL